MKYQNNLAVYSIKAKDSSICKINTYQAIDSKNTYEILGLKEGTTSLIVTETYFKKSSVVGEIQVNVVRKPESLQIKNKYLSNNKNEEFYFTVAEGTNGDINTFFDVTPKLLNLQFTCSNEAVVSIDKETGRFEAKTPGEAIITISARTATLNIKISVISKNKLPELCETSEKYV